MLGGQIWRRLADSEIGNELEGLRADRLRLLFAISLVGFVTWHVLVNVFASPEDDLSHRWLFPLILILQILTYLVIRSESIRNRYHRAAWFFLFSSVLSVTVGIWILDGAAGLLLYPVIALGGVVLVSALAGLVVSAASLVTLVVLRVAGPLAFITSDQLVEVAIATALTVGVAWILDRNLLVAIEWSLQNYDTARQNAKDAREHRAQLVQALSQLDSAYYRLEQANAALELAWKATEAAERSKSEFVTNISHELRTPLNLIVGFSEMIVTSPESYGAPLPPAYRGDVNAIYRSAQHLLTLTDDVIDLARVGSARLALAREQVDLGQILRDACDIVREYIAAKGIYLRVEVAPDLPALSVDRLRIRQVMLNLLTNASRFTDRGGIIVTAEEVDGLALVKVADTGAGVAPAELQRVFDEYHTSGPDVSKTGGFGGLGLGLPLSKRLVEMHGGRMGVESTLGLGTTFWFALPIGSGEPQSKMGAPAFGGPRPTGVKERALVLVGAEAHCSRFLQRHLHGYRIVNAHDFASGVTVARELRATAILAGLDVDEDRHSAQSPVPIVRLPLPQSDHLIGGLGAAGFLAKPITRQQLREAVEGLGRPVERVLVVDDDPRFAKLVERMLRSILRLSPGSVTGVYNGSEALAEIEARRPDLVLLDMILPGLQGHEVLAAMSNRSELAEIAVIVISGQDEQNWRMPMVGSLSVTKPGGFVVEEVLAGVEALLRILPPSHQLLSSGAESASAEGSGLAIGR